MEEPFDAYYVWLGIRPEDQPPNYYRLLGLSNFESNLDAIESAAEQRIRHVRSFQVGPRVAESQRILNQLASARACLVDERARIAYDENLRREILPSQGKSTPVVPIVIRQASPLPPPLPSSSPFSVAQAAPAIPQIAPSPLFVINRDSAPSTTRNTSRRRNAEDLPDAEEPIRSNSGNLVAVGAVGAAVLLIGIAGVAIYLTSGKKEDERAKLVTAPVSEATETAPMPKVKNATPFEQPVSPKKGSSSPSAKKDQTRPNSGFSSGKTERPELAQLPSPNGRTPPEFPTPEVPGFQPREEPSLPPLPEPIVGERANPIPGNVPPAKEVGKPDAVKPKLRDKLARPNKAELAKAQAELKESRGAEVEEAMNSSRPDARKKLAEDFVRAAQKIEAKPSLRFALFMAAERLMQAAPNLPSAIKIIDEMAAEFDFDDLTERKAAILNVAQSESVSNNQVRQDIAMGLIDVVNQAINEDRIDLALELGDALQAVADGTEITAFRKDITTIRKDLTAWKESIAAMKKASAKLADSPADGEANTVMGKHLCFFGEQWETGAPYLALGNNDELAAAAKKDLTAVKAADAAQADTLLAAADNWFDVAKSLTGPSRTSALKRAQYWYQKCILLSNDLTKTEVEKQLAEAGRMLGEIAKSRPGGPKTIRSSSLPGIVDPLVRLQRRLGNDWAQVEKLTTDVARQDKWQKILQAADKELQASTLTLRFEIRNIKKEFSEYYVEIAAVNQPPGIQYIEHLTNAKFDSATAKGIAAGDILVMSGTPRLSHIASGHQIARVTIPLGDGRQLINPLTVDLVNWRQSVERRK